MHWLMAARMIAWMIAEKKILTIVAIFALFHGRIAEARNHVHPTPWAIYGPDDRRDICDEADADKRALATATAAMIDRKFLKRDPRGGFDLLLDNYGRSLNLCEDERFFEQSVLADCTGFLVAPNLLVTAGHCITNGHDCRHSRFVFDFAYLTAGQAPTHATKSSVYRCKELIVSKNPDVGADFAVIKLDRPVIGRTPLRLRHHGRIGSGEDVLMIGHPEGLPMKIAGPAKVRSSHHRVITANLDAFGGNSGSPVFNATTLEVEGILVRGDEDFIETRGPAGEKCNRSYRCHENDCLGEDLTPIAYVLPYLTEPKSIK